MLNTNLFQSYLCAALSCSTAAGSASQGDDVKVSDSERVPSLMSDDSSLMSDDSSLMLDDSIISNSSTSSLREGPILDFKLPKGGRKSIDFSHIQNLGLTLRGRGAVTIVSNVTKGSYAEMKGVQLGWTLFSINNWIIEGIAYLKVYEELQNTMKTLLIPIMDHPTPAWQRTDAARRRRASRQRKNVRLRTSSKSVI